MDQYSQAESLDELYERTIKLDELLKSKRKIIAGSAPLPSVSILQGE